VESVDPKPLVSEGKYFTTSAADASNYARAAVNGFGDPAYTTVSTEFPTSKLPESVTIEKGIPAFVIPNQDLPIMVPKVQNFSTLPPSGM
jgi:hypothetical protein